MLGYKEPIQCKSQRCDLLTTVHGIGERRGQRRLEQQCLGIAGETLTVQTTWGGAGKRRDFEPVIGIPQEVRDQIPLIYIGPDRSLTAQLPGARNSLLRRMFEDIDQDLRAPSQTIELQRRDGTPVTVSRLERFRTLISAAMELLRTTEFDKLESAIKRHALDHLGLDTAVDDLDLYFTPLDTFDFYKSLDLMIREGDFNISATQMGGGMQNAIVLQNAPGFRRNTPPRCDYSDRRTGNVFTPTNAALALRNASAARGYQSDHLYYALAALCVDPRIQQCTLGAPNQGRRHRGHTLESVG